MTHVRPLATAVGLLGYSNGLIKLGTIESGIEALRRPGPLKVMIERLEK